MSTTDNSTKASNTDIIAATATSKSGAQDIRPTTNEPLAPPPKPSQSQALETPDYFSGAHNGSQLSLEPNPFEQQFGNPSSETPGKFGGLPSVASLTSPAPIGPGGTPGWQNSLRSGPLSPAMLPGPTNAGGYFDESFRASFPTPNESSLRTGLTPGGGGSMFPAPSPGSQAIFASMQSGGATPGTLEFQRTAMNAAARTKVENGNQNPLLHAPAMEEYKPAQQNNQHQHHQQNTFGSHPENDAVNGLYLLAQTGGRNANQFPNMGQQVNNSNSNNMMQMQRVGNQSQDQSPTSMRGKGSSGSIDEGQYNGSDDQNEKPPTRSRGKKGSASKAPPTINGRRKADEALAKTPLSKRAKTNAANQFDQDGDDDSDNDGSPEDEMEPTHHPNGKKMTDEEKRKNFLERNRVAALKCRQRKKQWLANLQTKVEMYTAENDTLATQCTQLREELVNLKTLLFAHKDCAVSHQQGVAGPAMAQILGDFNPHMTGHYTMIPNGQQMMGMQAGQGMQRR